MSALENPLLTQGIKDSAKAVLEGAKQHLETHGWVQGCYWSDDMGFELAEYTGRACSVGALDVAVARQDQDRGYDGYRLAQSLLCEQLPKEFRTHSTTSGDIILYNDDENTSKEDVLLVFKKAIGEFDA